MRLKLTRTTAPPTQCTDLEASSSQYWSKTSPAGTTFTDDFCAGAWIKLESYTGVRQVIISRFNGTSGWRLGVDSAGVVTMAGFNAGGSNTSNVSSYQSVPLNKWVHIVAQLDMSAFTATTTTSYIMIDGVSVPVSVNRSGTNPTALVQAGNLEVGSNNGGTEPLDGKIAQAWYSSAKITQATIQGYISQGMTGSETSIVSHYDFNGDGNDNNANANNLTAQASAGFTTDSPFNATEYGIITANSFSTNTTLTVQVPEGYAIPTSGGVSAVAYSTQDTPYGFPRDKGKWELVVMYSQDGVETSITNDVWYNKLTEKLNIPIGAWIAGYSGCLNIRDASGTSIAGESSLSTSASAETDIRFSVSNRIYGAAGAIENTTPVYVRQPLSVTSATDYYLIYRVEGTVSGTANRVGFLGSFTPTMITVEFAYV